MLEKAQIHTKEAAILGPMNPLLLGSKCYEFEYKTMLDFLVI